MSIGTMSLSDRVAIVTGAGGGLGRCHALELARHGAKIVVNDLDADGAESVAAEIREQGGEAVSFSASVTDEERIAAMVAETLERWGRIDILVNNAGILRDRSFAKMELDEFRLVVDVHLMGAVICSKAVWETMRSQRHGRIIMTTSSSGLYGNFGQANYGAAKMALVGLMQTLSIEGEKYNICVNCLAPTAATQMTGDVLAKEALEKLDPAFVSPGIVPMVADDAPTRAILCAGAGHFAVAHITLTGGAYIGEGEGAAERVGEYWGQITNRAGEIVPKFGFTQGQRELESAGADGVSMTGS